MPYDATYDPFWSSARSPISLGRKGALVAPSDAADLATYARIRVWVPDTLAAAAIAILPIEAADNAPITLNLPVGQVSVLEYLVRRVLATGTTAGLVNHTIQ